MEINSQQQFLNLINENRNFPAIQRLLPEVKNCVKLAAIIQLLTSPLTKWTYDRQRHEFDIYRIIVEILKSVYDLDDMKILLDDKNRRYQQLIFGNLFWYVEYERKGVRRRLNEIGLVGLAVDCKQYRLAKILYAMALDVDAGRKIQFVANHSIRSSFLQNGCDLYPLNSPPPLLLIVRTKCCRFLEKISLNSDCVLYVQKIGLPPSFITFLSQFLTNINQL